MCISHIFLTIFFFLKHYYDFLFFLSHYLSLNPWLSRGVLLKVCRNVKSCTDLDAWLQGTSVMVNEKTVSVIDSPPHPSSFSTALGLHVHVC